MLWLQCAWGKINYLGHSVTDTHNKYSKNDIRWYTHSYKTFESINMMYKDLRPITLISSSTITSSRCWSVRWNPMHFNGELNWSNDFKLQLCTRLVTFWSDSDMGKDTQVTRPPACVYNVNSGRYAENGATTERRRTISVDYIWW